MNNSDTEITVELTAESTSALYRMVEDLDLSKTTEFILHDKYGNTARFIKAESGENL